MIAPDTADDRPPGAYRAIAGCLIGTAVGDAMGLACEGLSRQRQARMFPDLAGYHLLGNRGLTSDDTEHACMLAQALIASGGEKSAFARSLAWRLRLWLAGLPAGIGLATLRSILKLWLGLPPHRSGVDSAGNGPAMRVALLGVCHGGDSARFTGLVEAATRITHTDIRALHGALAVALAAHQSVGRAESPDFAVYRAALVGLTGERSELLGLVDRVGASLAAGDDTATFADSIGCARGVTGYMLHTVPVVLHAWLRHPADYRAAVLETIRCGGDTDTTAAIVGALVGARAGVEGIPADWRARLVEWPRTIPWMLELSSRVAEVLASDRPGRPVALNIPGLAVRNLLFIPLVLAHGLRRLLPPY